MESDMKMGDVKIYSRNSAPEACWNSLYLKVDLPLWPLWPDGEDVTLYLPHASAGTDHEQE